LPSCSARSRILSKKTSLSKARFILGFDSEIFLDKIRERAEHEGKSITQFVNEAVAYYLEKKKR
jgi:hypothetical protein